jgi:hypothetical protein
MDKPTCVRHEPEPDSYATLDGSPVGILDSDSYPLRARCGHCGRQVRCERLNGSWVTADMHAGINAEGREVYNLEYRLYL